MKFLYALLGCLLLVAQAHATTWYVAKTGSNSNDCTAAQNTNTPKLTIAAALACIGGGAGAGGGHTVTILDSTAVTYTESFGDGLFPKGASPSSRFTLQAQTPGVVTIRPASGYYAFDFQYQTVHYVTFKNFICDGINLISSCFKVDGNYVTWDTIEIKNSPGMGILGGGNNWYVVNTSIHDNGYETESSPPGGYAIYFTGTDSIFERSHFYSNGGCGLHFYNTPATIHRNIIRYNWIHNNGTNSASNCNTEVLIGSGDDNLFHHNIVGSATTGSEYGISIQHGGTNNRVYNNTVYNNSSSGDDIAITMDTCGGIIRNNIVYANGDNRINDIYSCNTISNNLLTNPSFIDAANNNFGLTAGSSNAINQGINVSLPYNGSAPDIGAHESFVLSSCSVESGDASTLRLVFENNVYPPVAGISITGFTYQINDGSWNGTKAAASGGTNQINLTLQAAVEAGQTIDFSYTTAGSIRDSANIGGSKNQRLNEITDYRCANNVSGGGGITLTVSHFRIHNLRSSSTSAPESTRYLLAATDTNTSVMPGAAFGVRTKVKCTGGDCASIGVNLRYQKNGSGGYTLIPDTCGADNIAMVGTSNTSADIPAQGTATTEQLTSDFATNVAGAIARTSSAIPNLDLSQDSETEMEHLLMFCTGASVGDYYDFRPYKQDGTALDTYTITPRVTLTNSRFTQ